MHQSSQAREKTIMLGLSIALHISFLLLLLVLTDPSLLPLLTKKPDLENQESPLFNHTRMAALKPRANRFGVPVLFSNDIEDDAPPAPPTTPDNSMQQHQEEEPPQLQANNDNAQEDTDAKENNTEQAQKSETLPEKTNIIEETHLTQDTPESKLKPKSTSENNVQETKQIQEPLKKEVVRKKIAPPKQKTVRMASAAKQATRQLTLADLAQGFLESLHHEGDDDFKRDGDTTLRPDLSDLKYQSYVKKLLWYMQHEWKANQSKLKVHPEQNLVLCLMVTIAKDGSITGIHIAKSSGSTELDTYLINGINKASPYPPLPDHFKKDSFDLPLSVHYITEQAVPWRMSLRN